VTAAWIAYALLVGALVALAARGVEGACRLAAWPVRWVWAGAIALTLAFIALAPQRSALRASPATEVRAVELAAIPSAHDAAQGEAPTIERRLLARLHAVGAYVAAPISALLAAAQRRVPASLGPSLVIAWLTLSAVLLALFAAVHTRFYRARRHWPAAELHGVRVRLAPEAGPAVVGLSHPEIVVPRWLLLRSPEEQRLTLAHEQEHLRARDPFLLAAACVAVVLLPWHPAVWWMLSRLRLAVELDCDGRVLRRGVAPRSYGTLLIELAERCSGLGVGAAAFADASSHLERRLLAMKRTRPRFARARGGVLAAAAALALLVACDAQLPTSAEVEQMDVASAEKAVVRTKMLASTDSVVFMVDGVRMSAERARALNPDQIARIEVLRASMDSTLARRRGEIRITTKQAAARELRGMTPSRTTDAAARREAEVVRADAAASHNHDSEGRAVAGVLFVDGTHMSVAPITDTIATSKPIGMDHSFAGIVLIDGVRADAAAMEALSPRQIRGIEVIKGPTATKLYSDPRAANGVIKISTHDKP
jgi:beta-lactamase regulating signal transducer with metallopeptidase domain